MINPKISVLILSYNRPEKLKKCVTSVLRQKYSNFEIILLDNGSDFSVSEVLGPALVLDKRLRIINFRKNKKVSIRLNQGLKIANGEYFSFLCDDSYWCPEALDILTSGIYPEVDFLSARVRLYDETNDRFIENTLGKYDWKKGEIKTLSPISFNSFIVRRDIIDQIGGFNENLTRDFALDFFHRIHIDKNFSTGKHDDWVSTVTVNKKDNFSLSNLKRDFDPPMLEIPNPLKNKLSIRKSVSFVSDEKNLIEGVNKLNLNTCAVHGKSDTDALVTWANLDLLDSYKGQIIYYQDYKPIKDDALYNKSSAVLSQFSLDIDKPHFFLRESMSADLIQKQIKDRIANQAPKEMRLALNYVDEDNIDFTYILLTSLEGSLTVVMEENMELYHLCKEYPINFEWVPEVNFENLNGKNIDFILDIEPDFNYYLRKSKSFKLACLLNVPYLSNSNIFTKDFLSEKSFLKFETVQDFKKCLSKFGDLKIIEEVKKNAFNILLDDFVDKNEYSKFCLFLEDLVDKKPLPSLEESYLVEQTKGKLPLRLSPNSFVSQFVNKPLNQINGVEFYSKNLNNDPYTLTLEVFLGGNKKVTKLPHYKIVNGWNRITFKEPLTSEENKELIIKLECDNNNLMLFYSPYVYKIGIFRHAGKANRACLNFKIF